MARVRWNNSLANLDYIIDGHAVTTQNAMIYNGQVVWPVDAQFSGSDGSALVAFLRAYTSQHNLGGVVASSGVGKGPEWVMFDARATAGPTASQGLTDPERDGVKEADSNYAASGRDFGQRYQIRKSDTLTGPSRLGTVPSPLSALQAWEGGNMTSGGTKFGAYTGDKTMEVAFDRNIPITTMLVVRPRSVANPRTGLRKIGGAIGGSGSGLFQGLLRQFTANTSDAVFVWRHNKNDPAVTFDAGAGAVDQWLAVVVTWDRVNGGWASTRPVNSQTWTDTNLSPLNGPSHTSNANTVGFIPEANANTDAHTDGLLIAWAPSPDDPFNTHNVFKDAWDRYGA